MANYLIKDNTLRDIADAIRGKTGSSEPIEVKDMAVNIAGISGGSGSVVEMCTGTLDITSPLGENRIVIYSTNENMQYVATKMPAMGGTFTAAKGTLFVVDTWTTYSTAVGCTQVIYNNKVSAFMMDGDCTLTFNL